MEHIFDLTTYRLLKNKCKLALVGNIGEQTLMCCDDNSDTKRSVM